MIDRSRLPPGFPTHKHDAAFWEALGRAVGTFGFLEEVLGKAIFAMTATKQVDEERAGVEVEKWLTTLKRALDDPLKNLIDSFEKAAHHHGDAGGKDLDDLLGELRKASVIRNALCHGSWRIPDDQGRCVPLYVDKKRGVFETPVDINFLQEVQRGTAGLCCSVIETVTHLGWRFPGSQGPGKPIWE